MKTKLIALCSLVLFMTSCNKDFLNITPDGRITLEDVFNDEKQTEAYLNTVYLHIPSYFWKYGFFDFLASFSDETYAYSGAVMAWSAGSVNPGGNPIHHTPQERGKGANRYPFLWTGIHHANVFLAHVDDANIPSPTNRNRFRAEAQVLRAFYFWELIKEYGPLPIITEQFAHDFDYTTLTRPTFQECVDFIASQCDEAIANPDLPMRITIEADRGRVTKAMAYAVKSQATLYNASPLWNPGNDNAKWQVAAEASRTAVLELMANGYELYSDYGEYFLSRTDISTSPRDRETIYEINEGSDPTYSIINSIPSKPGMFKVGATPTQELVDSYEMQATGEPAILGYRDETHLDPIINVESGYDPNNPYVGRDPRFYATVWYNGAQYNHIGGAIHTIQTFVGGPDQLLKAPIGWAFTRTGYYLRKFIDPQLQSGQPEDARWKKYRLAEIFLNFAEAENEANGPNGDVHMAVNAVRGRVQMPALPAGLSQDQMRERIRRERRVELAIEEHRFWDVRRWKILHETDKLVTGVEITPQPDGMFSYERFVTEQRNAWQDKFLLFPIPIGETSIIPDFDLNQNPGW